jgi:hypothetical protein
MRLFNQVVLARLAWRLIYNLDSLCARLVKVKYYPNGELIDTVFPGEVSSTWRSIEHGLDLLKKGLIWRVRSGTKVRIWRELDSEATILKDHYEERKIADKMGITIDEAR